MKKIIIFVLLITSYLVVSRLYHAGVFKRIDAHSNLTDITIYTNVAGTEDLEMDTSNGLLFISSTDRWNSTSTAETMDGIYLLDINSATKPIKLETTYQGEFHPHGMSLLNKDKKIYLFVINHNQLGNFVELFQFENNILHHLRSFENEQMCCPNDLVAVDLDKFYLTNDHGAAKGLMRILEDYLRIANAYVLYFDGEKYTKVYEDLNYANGINLSADGNTLYLSETTGRRISVLDRNPTSGKLTLRFIKDLHSGIDNITIDVEGNLWLASHPKLLAFVGHSKGNGEISPSQVLKLTADGENDFKVSEVYLNNGEEISGSSTALYYKGELFIGVVFENKLLRGSYGLD